jgi:hypothetical protein
MANYNTQLQSNNTDLQAILNTINELPEAGGVELPILTNEGSVSDLLSGKELIDGDGNKITGTFTIDSELSTQDSLISQIQTAVNNLPEAGSGSEDLDTELTTQESLISELSTILNSKASGGGSGIEYEIVTITESSTTIPFTLARVTSTFGLYNGTTFVGGQANICGHIDTLRLVARYQGSTVCAVVDGFLFLEDQALTAGVNFVAPYTAVFINDPSKEAIYG